MELRQLEALVAVVETGSFTAAARLLYLTQPAVTHSIKRLEREVGAQLLVRGKPKVLPSREGERLVALARRVAQEIDDFKNELKSSGALRGEIRVVCTTTGFAYFYADLCERFMKAYPSVEINLRTVETPSAGVRQVRDGIAELAFTSLLALPQTLTGVKAVPLGITEDIVIAGINHPLGTRGEVGLEELSEFPFILYERETGTRQQYDQLFAPPLPRPPTVIESNDTEFIKRLVMMGRGVALVSCPTVREEIASGRLRMVRIQGMRLYQEYGVVYSEARSRMLSRLFVDFCTRLERADNRAEQVFSLT